MSTGPHNGIRFDFPGKPLLVNEASKNCHWQISRAVEQYVHDGYYMGKASKVRIRGHRVTVLVHHFCKGTLADSTAAFWSAKGAQDGLVKAGVLEDDGPAYVAGVHFLAPVRAAKDGITLELVPE